MYFAAVQYNYYLHINIILHRPSYSNDASLVTGDLTGTQIYQHYQMCVYFLPLSHCLFQREAPRPIGGPAANVFRLCMHQSRCDSIIWDDTAFVVVGSVIR